MRFIYPLSKLRHAARHLIEQAGEQTIWTFKGEMGSGKTTLIKALCKELGVTDEVSSPTFSLVNEYATEGGQVVYHFDFYRVQSIEEVYDIGYEDYFYSGNLCLVEWPDKIKELLNSDEVFEIVIEKVSDEERAIVLTSS